MLKPIILTTLNARYSHTAFGLRCLMANLGRFQPGARLLEFTIHQRTLDIVERLLLEEPSLIGFGIYVWNVTETTAVMQTIRQLRPEIRLVIGGPEVSYEYEALEAFRLADHLIPGEGEVAFVRLLEALEQGAQPEKVQPAQLPNLAQLHLPYALYTDADLAQRLIYVEASRGCPFRCEFCLSSLAIPVRTFPLEPFLDALGDLLARGARSFKFVDRTFNLNMTHACGILAWLLGHLHEGLELHFEMIPDQLPEALRALIRQFPDGMVQLEIGIQTLTPMVSKNISRPQRIPKIRENFHFLRTETGVHIHADLIAGLPGEDSQSFAHSFNALLALGPDEIQLGMLKRLRGTPIARHTEPHGLVFSPNPPYEILQTNRIPFQELQRLKRFARYFELFHNHGHFLKTIQHVFGLEPTPFQGFLTFTDWLWEHSQQTHQFGLARLCRAIFTYLTEVRTLDPHAVARDLLEDYDRQQVRRSRLEFLRPWASTIDLPTAGRSQHKEPGQDRPQDESCDPLHAPQQTNGQSRQHGHKRRGRSATNPR